MNTLTYFNFSIWADKSQINSLLKNHTLWYTKDKKMCERFY